jgi:hypothetical protein
MGGMKNWTLLCIVTIVFLVGCVEPQASPQGEPLACPECSVSNNEYTQLMAEKQGLEAQLVGVQEPPYIAIQGRNVTFAFKTLNGDVYFWEFPFDSYEASYNNGFFYRESGPEYVEAYAERMEEQNEMCELDSNVAVSWCNYAAALGGNDDCVQERRESDEHCAGLRKIRQETYDHMKGWRIIPKLTLEVAGESVRIQNFSMFVRPAIFTKFSAKLNLDSGNDEQFVKEVFNIVQQITTYVPELQETPRYPLETLTGAGGDCEDSSILTASILRAANPDWTVQLVYLDSDNPTDPKDVNHVIVYVDTGEYSTYIETTAKKEMNPYTNGVNGWKLYV